MPFGFASEKYTKIFRLKQCNNGTRQIHPGYKMNSSFSLLFVVSWGGLLEKKYYLILPGWSDRTCKNSCLFSVEASKARRLSYIKMD